MAIFNTEDLIKWEELAPSLQKIIKHPIMFSELDSTLQHMITKPHVFSDLDPSLQKIIMRLIKFNELDPSLQKIIMRLIKFNELDPALQKMITDLQNLLNGIRITISTAPPANPIANKEIYVDLNTNYIYKYDTTNGPLSWNGIFAVRSNLTYNIPTSDVGGNIWID